MCSVNCEPEYLTAVFNQVSHWYEAISFLKGVLPTVLQSLWLEALDRLI